MQSTEHCELTYIIRVKQWMKRLREDNQAYHPDIVANNVYDTQAIQRQLVTG
ncbi:hypothetical protein [Catenovulum agarivorans]|uniref:hypothetical protein n=1 Tax=Catenovulum agarivorans TaxID=1172192 RepID=UPI0002F2482B|nr:hypothetical protein [Catenovulum agarivorans]